MTEEKLFLAKACPSALPPFFQRIDWLSLAFWGTVLLACFLRFYDLANMPLHHDESLYGVYCWRFFMGQGYQYDPMMHGPFMFHFQVLLFFLFGVSDFSVRIAPAFLGCLLIASTYYLKDFVGKMGIVLIAIFLTFSPTHLYFSRFMRHDSYVAFFTYASAVFGLLYARYRHKTSLYLSAASLALMFCEKENSYIHAFIFVTFFVLKEFCQTFVFRLPEYRGNLLKRYSAFWQEQKYSLILAGFLFFWIYLLFYTTFFTNPNGFLDGLYRKSLVYWWNQHKIQRIKGPFHYYVPFFFLYELPIFLIVLGGILVKIARTVNKAIVAAWATIFAGVLTVFYGHRDLPLWFAFTHMEIWFDLIITLYVLFIGLWAVLYLLKQRETLTAFFTYWSAIGFLIYSYAGEKVPWLFLHVVLPMCVLAGILLCDFFTSSVWNIPSARSKSLRYAAIILGGMGILYFLHTTILLNYSNRANPAERMVYTQTSTDIVKMVKVIEDMSFSLGQDPRREPLVAVQGNAVWPLHWYLRDYAGWYVPGDLHENQRPMVVIDWEKREEYRDVFADGYQEIRVKLREWWIPDSTGTLKQWWRYFMYREVFNPTGSSDIVFYIKR